MNNNKEEMLNQLAEQILLIDREDAQEWSSLCLAVNALSESYEQGSVESKRVADVCGRIGGSIVDDSIDRHEIISEAAELIEMLQQSLKEERPMVATPVKSTEDDAEPVQFKYNQMVDDELFASFVEQQHTGLQQLEELILDYENTTSASSLDGIRRLIHTMKGEAGVVGIDRLQQSCHIFEDYLLDYAESLSSDLLLTMKDWLLETISDCAKKQTSRDPQLLKQLIADFVGDSRPIEPEAPDSTVVSEASEEQVLAFMKGTYPVNEIDLARDFIVESQDLLEAADAGLMQLENDPGNTEVVGDVFRSLHTIKGVSGFLALDPISVLSHDAETILDDIRKKKKNFEGLLVDLLFASLDMLKNMMQDLQQAISSDHLFHTRPDFDILLHKLRKVNEGSAAKSVVSAAAPSVPEKNIDQPVSPPSIPPAEPSEAGMEPQSAKMENMQTPPDYQAAVPSFVKIDAARLDLLIDTIGELVIAEAIVGQDPDIRRIKSLRLERNMGHLNKISRTLQDMSMAMRMTPIDATFRKMARLVRDLAKKSGKRIEFSMHGQETELDRGIVEKLGDPLMHMIRNAVDHGVESAEQREAAGKSAQAHVLLNAFHQGGNIHIQVKDDGFGLDRDAIVAKALKKELITSAENLSDADVYAMIFEAGFSTASKVTEISGRGVGMDVVRRNIESLRGKIMIDTAKGVGTTFTIVLPLTTAIIDGMVVRVGNEHYIVPTLSIVESFRPGGDSVKTIKGKGEVLSFRDDILPVVRISRVFEIGQAIETVSEALVMVVEDTGRKIALVVDELLGQQQTVIKSLGDTLGVLPGIAGASIMSDGRPGLILDVSGLTKLAMENKQGISVRTDGARDDSV